MKHKYSVLVLMSIVALFLFVSANVVSAAVKVTSAAPESVTLKPGKTIKIGLQGNDLRSVKSAYVAMIRSVVVEGKRKIRETRIRGIKANIKYYPPRGKTKGSLGIILKTDPEARFAFKGKYSLKLILRAESGGVRSKHRVAALKIHAGPVQYDNRVGAPPKQMPYKIKPEDKVAISSRRLPEQIIPSLAKKQRTIPAPDLPIEQPALEVHPAQGPAVIGTQGNYIKLADGTVIDTKNKLMWFSITAGRFPFETMRSVVDYCGQLDRGGYHDWRVPTNAEVKSLYLDRPQGAGGYYSKCNQTYTVKLTNLIRLDCTHVIAVSAFTESDGWGVDMTTGQVCEGGHPSDIWRVARVLPVRTWNAPGN